MIPLLFLTFLSTLWILEGRIPAQPLPPHRIRHALVNFSLNVLNFAILAGFSLVLIGASRWAESKGFGIWNWLGWNGIAAVIAAVLAYDCVNYWIHRIQHVFPLLWRIHRSHHTDSYLDVTSALRFHPIESLFRVTIQILTVAALGMPLAALFAYSILVVSVLVFSHSNIRIHPGLERRLFWLIVLPSLHRVHHSIDRREHDRNFGIVFVFWDLLFRTFHRSLDQTGTLKIGLSHYGEQSHETPIKILLDPLRR